MDVAVRTWQRATAVDAAPAWDALTLAVAGYILTAIGRVHQLFGPLEALHPAVLTGALAIGLYLFDGTPERRAARAWSLTASLIVAFIFMMLLSTPFALSVGTSVDLVFNNFIKTAVISFVIVASVRRAEDVERLGFVYFAGAVIYSCVIITRFAVGDGDDWRLGHLYYYDANDFATFVVTSIPFGIYFLHAAPKGSTRAFAAVGLLLLTLGFVRSGSRGGFIAMSAVALYIVLRYSAIPLRWRLGATAFVAVVVLATASDHYWQQMGTITSEDDYNHTSETGRLQIWSRGIGYMVANPILGVGPNNFPAAEGTLSPLASRQQFGIGVRWNAAHNTYVQVGAEMGLPGLGLLVAIIASVFVALGRARHRSRLAPVLTATLIGFVVGAFFLSLAYSEMLYTLIALALGLAKVTARGDADA